MGVKDALVAAMVLAYPIAKAELALVVEDSAAQLVAASQQQLSWWSSWQPLGCLSKKMEPALTHYSEFDRELLAYAWQASATSVTCWKGDSALFTPTTSL